MVATTTGPACAEAVAELVHNGMAAASAGSWRAAQGWFAEAEATSSAGLRQVGDSYEALGQQASSTAQARHLHGQAKRCYRHLCQLPAPSAQFAADARTRLGAQHAALADLLAGPQHNAELEKAIDSYSQAIAQLDDMVMPMAHWGRLQAVETWLMQHQGFWPGMWHRHRIAEMRLWAWSDLGTLLTLLQGPATPTQLWEHATTLAALGQDDDAAQVAVSGVLPALAPALRDPGSKAAAWTACAALLSDQPALAPAALAAAHDAVASEAVGADDLPQVLPCYDTAVRTEPAAALAYCDDLAALRVRFNDRFHDVGSLVFTTRRYLEAAASAGNTLLTRQCLRMLEDIARTTPDAAVLRTAVYALGYVAQRIPSCTEAGLQALADLPTHCLLPQVAEAAVATTRRHVLRDTPPGA